MFMLEEVAAHARVAVCASGGAFEYAVQTSGSDIVPIDAPFTQEADKGSDTIPVHSPSRTAIAREEEEWREAWVVEHCIPEITNF